VLNDRKCKILCATEGESGNVEVQRNNINKILPDTMGDWIGKVREEIRKPWITQQIMNKVNDRRQWKNVNIEQGMKTY
jgi:hypothetical protein